MVNYDFIKKLSKTHHKDTYKVNDTIETTVDLLKTDASVMKNMLKKFITLYVISIPCYLFVDIDYLLLIDVSRSYSERKYSLRECFLCLNFAR